MPLRIWPMAATSYATTTITMEAPSSVKVETMPCDPILERLLLEHVREDFRRKYGNFPQHIKLVEKITNHSSKRYRVSGIYNGFTGWLYVGHKGEVYRN